MFVGPCSLVLVRWLFVRWLFGFWNREASEYLDVQSVFGGAGNRRHLKSVVEHLDDHLEHFEDHLEHFEDLSVTKFVIEMAILGCPNPACWY